MEPDRQISLLASIISAQVLDRGIGDVDDARVVASRIYAAGFRMTDLDRSLESRLRSVEQRLSAVEGWCGVSRLSALP